VKVLLRDSGIVVWDLESDGRADKAGLRTRAVHEARWQHREKNGRGKLVDLKPPSKTP